jgi:hypothetical protein
VRTRSIRALWNPVAVVHGRARRPDAGDANSIIARAVAEKVSPFGTATPRQGAGCVGLTGGPDWGDDRIAALEAQVATLSAQLDALWDLTGLAERRPRD